MENNKIKSRDCKYPNCFNCILPDCADILSYKAMKQREYNIKHPDRVIASNQKYYQTNKNTEEYKKRNRENQAKWREKHNAS